MTTQMVLGVCLTSYCVATVLGALVAALLELSHARQPRRSDHGEGF